MEPTLHGLGTDALTASLVALALNAHRCLDGTDPVDYWYRLGQRNAYAQVVGFLLAGGDSSRVWSVSDRVNRGLSAGVSEVAELASAARAAAAAGCRAGDLAWVGPAAFQRQAGTGGGGDLDVGSSWGRRRDRRVAVRTAPGSSSGLLYAYDATWDEYAVLALGVDPEVVREAYRSLPDRDDGADVEDLVRALHARAPGPRADHARFEVELWDQGKTTSTGDRTPIFSPERGMRIHPGPPRTPRPRPRPR